MLEKNIVEGLDEDCRDLVINFLDIKSLASASRVSWIWYGLFTYPHIWKDKIKSDFAIDQEILSSLPIPDNQESPLFYKKLYAHLYRLQQKQTNLPKFVKDIYHDQTQQSLLLMACADNAEDAFRNTPCEEQHALTVMSVYAGCINIPIVFLKKNQQKKHIDFIFFDAIKSGNLPLVKYLLNSENGFNLVLDQDRLYIALRAGNLELVQYLLNPKNQYSLKPSRHTLYCAATSGNFQVVQYLLNPENGCHFKPDHKTLDEAAKSGNLQLVQYLLNLENKFGLKPSKLTLSCAARLGNLQLVKYLLNPDQFVLKPDQAILYCAVQSGNFQLVEYLLNQENQFDLEPYQTTLDAAAESGNLQLVKCLLNEENQFDLKPNQSTLNAAAKSGNFQLVEYLLNEENQFDLKPNQSTLNTAAKSGNFQLVEYLLNQENQFDLNPNHNTLNEAAYPGNLQLMKYLLNPKNRYNLNPEQETLEEADRSGNLGLSKHLLSSHIFMQQMLQLLEKSDFGLATELLQKAYTACPSHCTMWVEHVLNHPSEFNLKRKVTQRLSHDFEEIKAKIFSQEEITTSNKKTRSMHPNHHEDDGPASMDLS